MTDSWDRMLNRCARYQHRTARETPVVICEPRATGWQIRGRPIRERDPRSGGNTGGLSSVRRVVVGRPNPNDATGLRV